MSLKRLKTSTLRHRKIAPALIITGICFLAWSGSVRSLGKPRPEQLKEKIVVKHAAPANEPIEIVDASVKTKAITLGVGFESEPDWLRDVAFKVKNKSDKVITFLQIDLDFPETKEAAGAIMMHQLFFGQRTDFKSRVNRPALHLPPNETIEISLEKEYEGIKTLIELKHPSMDVINKLVIRTGDMMFEDGTLFSSGIFLRRNPDSSSPQKWIPIDGAERRAGNN